MHLHNVQMYENVLRWFITLFTYISVGLFFFLSGYGNYYSIQRKNAKIWLLDKVLMLYSPITIIVLITYVLSYFIPMYAEMFTHWYSAIQKIITMSLSFGAQWYVKETLILYFVFFLCYKYIKKPYNMCYLTVLCVLWVFISLFLHTSSWLYQSTLAFPLGCFFAEYKNQIMYFYQKHFYKISIFSLILLSIFTYCASICWYGLFMVFINIFACIIMAGLTIKIELKSALLKHLGQYSLLLYLTHTEFILIFRRLNINGSGALCTILTILLSIVAVFILNVFTNKLQKFLYNQTAKLLKIGN